jgi:hypothetical protein
MLTIRLLGTLVLVIQIAREGEEFDYKLWTNEFLNGRYFLSLARS